MVDCIVLAGGLSTRAKTNKMLFMVENRPLISYTVNNMSRHVDHVIVVTGKFDQEIREVLKGSDADIIYNKDYEQGMFTSVKTGVKLTKGDFFILPGDCPFVSSNTFNILKNGKKSVRVPTFLGQDGHPLFISHELKDELLNEPDDSNLKVFRDRHDIERIAVNDPNILNDIDTVEDYQRLLKERK